MSYVRSRMVSPVEDGRYVRILLKEVHSPLGQIWENIHRRLCSVEESSGSELSEKVPIEVISWLGSSTFEIPCSTGFVECFGRGGNERDTINKSGEKLGKHRVRSIAKKGIARRTLSFVITVLHESATG